MRPRKPRLAAKTSVSLSPRATNATPVRSGMRSPLESALGAFRTECDAAIEALRAALRALAIESGSDPLRPQEVSRRFGINKNLTWKFARVLLAQDSFEAIPMLPGPEGVEIYLRAFEAVRIPVRFTDAVRESMRIFDGVVARHFGDRAQLELVLDGLRLDGNLEASRRMAFKGMSGVFGLRARVRVTAQIITPTPTKDGSADIALIVGLAGLQRLRPIGALPLLRAGGTSANGMPAPEPLVCSTGSDAPDYLLRDFSSFPNATVNTKSASGGRFALELSEGPLGRIGESDLFFATITRGAISLTQRGGDAKCNLITSVSIPAEAFASDLFVHKSVRGLESMRMSIHSTLAQPLTDDEQQQQATVLPIDAAPLAVEELASGYGILGVPRYEEMIGRAFAAMGQDPAEFRLFRVALAYPPAPSALLTRWDLPE